MFHAAGIRNVFALIVVCCGSGFLSRASAQDPSMLALGGNDPILLGQGKETAGDPAFSAEHYLYLYRFVDAANRELFRKDPERYGIQMGGGCGRMGPASGKGDVERYAVHDGRIYVFASDQCRAAFLKKPDAFLDPDDAAATGSEAAAVRARELLDLAEKAHGGAKLLAAKSLRFTQETTTKLKDGTERKDGRREIIRLPGDVRVESWWGVPRFVEVDAASGGFEVNSKGESTTRHATALRSTRRSFWRRPLLILRERGRADFKAFHVGEGMVGKFKTEQVVVSFDGMTTTLAIDPVSGLVHGTSSRGRGPEFWFGKVERAFSDFRDVGGLMIPFKTEVVFDGKPRPESTVIWNAVEVDAAIEPGDFRRPK